MKTRFITGIFLSLATCLLFVNSSQAQQARTGTHLNSKALAFGGTGCLEVPDEVERYSTDAYWSGRKDEALQLAAESYIEKVERVTPARMKQCQDIMPGMPTARC